MSKYLAFEDIINKPDLDEKELFVPEWDGYVKIRGLTKAQQQAMRRQASTANGQIDTDKLETIMLASCLVEPAITLEQAEQLKNKSAAAIDRILREILELAGLTEEAQKEAMKSFRPGV
ncbi:hypothetical protein CTH_2256 [Carboxydocella thermautotrophica]|nr:hypothetical protein CTH_2256 [Carboxydocella thermautotrophica]